MKKKGFIFLLCLLISLVMLNKVNAEVSHKEMVNLIDLKNIYLIGDQQSLSSRDSDRFLIMKDFVDVEVGKRYTVVVHEDFFEQDFDNFDLLGSEMDLKLSYGNNTNETVQTHPVYNHSYDTKGYAWGSFTASNNKVKISSLKSRVDNLGNILPYKIIMYQGEISDFKGFYSYKSNYTLNEGNLIVNVDNPLNINEIKALISLSGDVEIKVINDNYSTNNNTIGSYLIELLFKDDYYNVSFLDIKVHLVDIEAPIITGTNTYDIDISDIDSFSLNSVKANLNVTDNYSTLTSDDLVIINDTFTPNKTKSGSYLITFRAKDSSNNTTDYPVTINVIDNKPPTLTGPMEIFRYSTDPKLTLEEIISMYTAYDEVDGDVTSKITASGVIGTTPGKYEIIVSVKDNSNNTATKKLFLKVVEGIPPSFVLSDLILTNTEYQNMSKEDIIDWLNERLDGNVSNIEIIYDEIVYSDDGNFIYFSYLLDGRELFGRIEVINKTNKLFLILGLSSGFIVLSASMVVIVIKKKRK